MAPSINDLDLYELLGILPESNESKIKKAYRKKALKCHPDKNPNDPIAAEQWEKLSKALEILTDKKARAAYDRILKAKKAAELRNRALDDKRKRAKQDLEAREAASREQKEDAAVAAAKLQREIERLREEGSKLLEEEQRRLSEEIHKNSTSDVVAQEEEDTPKLKLKWKCQKGDDLNGGYSHQYLLTIFQKYGEITNLLVSTKKGGSAIVEFVDAYSADQAQRNESGLAQNPLKVTWISGKPLAGASAPLHPSSATTAGATGSPGNAEDFETAVLRKMMEAQMKKEQQQQQQTAGNEDQVSQQTRDTAAPTHLSSKERDRENIAMTKTRQAEERKRLLEQMEKEDFDDTR